MKSATMLLCIFQLTNDIFYGTKKKEKTHTENMYDLRF